MLLPQTIQTGRHVERGVPFRVPARPQEVHPRHQDDLRGPQEAQGARRPYRLHQGGLPVEWALAGTPPGREGLLTCPPSTPSFFATSSLCPSLPLNGAAWTAC